MVSDYKKHITREKFLNDGMNFVVEKNAYHVSYPEFLKYFKDLESFTRHNLIIGINFTYGWMPTIFDFRSDKFDEALEILHSVKNHCIVSAKQLETLKCLLNNSLVGSSKLLHFINPEIYAIWDSRVYRYLTGTEPHQNRIGNCDAFLSYLAFCEYLTKDESYKEVHESIISKIGYPMTKYRTAELIMFANGAKEK